MAIRSSAASTPRIPRTVSCPRRGGHRGTPSRQGPGGRGGRVDSGVGGGASISGMYDPMIAKLIVWDVDRDRARRRMLRALSEFEVEGVSSLIPLHMAIMRHPEFAEGGTLREFVEGGGYAREVEQD